MRIREANTQMSHRPYQALKKQLRAYICPELLFVAVFQFGTTGTE